MAAKKSKKSASRSRIGARGTTVRRPTVARTKLPGPSVTGASSHATGTSQEKTNDHLTAEEIERFREKLLAKRHELLGDMANLREDALNKSRKDAAGDLSSMPIHMADIGTDNYEQEFTLGLMENEQLLLREIDEALERIEKGTFGLCVATGKKISKARLRVKPWAKHCISYVRQNEKGPPSPG